MGRRALALGIAVAAIGVSAPSAWGAFPGRNGDLVVATAGGLQLVDPSTGSATGLCTDGVLCGRPTQPRVSPNGLAIAYVDAASHRPVVIAPDGSCLWCLLGQRLTSATGNDPAFRPGGRAITLASGGLRAVRLSGGRATRPVRGSASDAVWSSNGTLALVRGGWVWIRAAHHRMLRRLARGHSPSFSPDGSKLALVRRGEIWIVPLRRGRARRLVRGSSPAWSPDRSEIAYIGRGGAVNLISIHGGRRGRVGSITGSALDWQPLLAGHSCAVPHGATIFASSAEAVVYKVTTSQTGGFKVYGCMRALGVRRVLVSQPLYSEGGTFVTDARLAGRFAALETQTGGKGFNCGGGAERADLGDGAVSTLYSSPCGPQGASLPMVDSIALDSSGFTAWRVTSTENSGTVEQLYADDDRGTRVIDSAGPGGGNAIGNLALSGDSLTLTWTHDGAQRELTLR